MRVQLELQDSMGMTVAMHAANSGNVAIVASVLHDIRKTQVMNCTTRRR